MGPTYRYFSNLTVLKLYRAALDYQIEALLLVQPLKRPLNISRSYQYIGLTYGSLERLDLALQSLQQAYDEGRPLAAERTGQNIMANASLKLGDLYRTSNDQTKALAAYDESLRLYKVLDFAHYSYAAHKGKFLSYLALQNDTMASQELLTVLRLFDEYREKIVTERQKTFFFDREQDTYDLAVDFVYSRLGDSRRAFDYSEISRARNLRELMRHGAEVTQSSSGLDLKSSGNNRTPSAALSLNDIQQRLPERVQLVQYAVLEKKLLIWVVTRANFFSTVVDVEAAKLNQAIADTLQQISTRDDKASSSSLKNLYRLTIAPVRERLDQNKVLCLVPDKTLHYLPFQALLSENSNHYLLQDFQLMVSPSATILVESSDNARHRLPMKEERLLAVGNPSFDRRANPKLSNLPSAEREVEQLAESYSPRRILVREEATRESITKQISRADVVHFAAHYEIDPRSSLSSRLILGPESGDYAHAQQSGLSAADIYRMKLTRPRLVVLSGCNTGIEQQFAGEGPIGFARAFLVAGVPVVVASQWPVDSDATAALMIAFHRFRKVKLVSTTEALMHAQQEIMSRGNYHSPYFWAGFTVVGGYSDF
jgi:CHAT domain-containing protein